MLAYLENGRVLIIAKWCNVASLISTSSLRFIGVQKLQQKKWKLFLIVNLTVTSLFMPMLNPIPAKKSWNSTRKFSMRNVSSCSRIKSVLLKLHKNFVVFQDCPADCVSRKIEKVCHLPKIEGCVSKFA